MDGERRVLRICTSLCGEGFDHMYGKKEIDKEDDYCAKGAAMQEDGTVIILMMAGTDLMMTGDSMH